MLNALAGPARAVAHSSLRRTPSLPPFRALHASSSVLKKSSKKAADFVPEFEEEDDGDLFAVQTTQVAKPAASNASSALNREVRDTIWQIIKRGARPMSSIADARRARLPIKGNALEQYTAACETREDLESLREVLRAWRVMGKRVNGAQAEMIIRRCLETQCPDLAAELVENKLHYGITTIPDQPFFQLYSALLALPTPPSIAPSYYRSRKHSVALAQLVIRMRRKASRSAKAREAKSSSKASESTEEVDSEIASEENTAEEGAAEDVSKINAQSTTEKPLATPASKPNKIQLPNHTPLASDPIDEYISPAEAEVAEACFTALEQKGGVWAEAGRRIMSRKKWEQAVTERKAQSTELAA